MDAETASFEDPTLLWGLILVVAYLLLIMSCKSWRRSTLNLSDTSRTYICRWGWSESPVMFVHMGEGLE